jgi:glycosyltransferase involved in cell wall biosynthesis
MSPLVSVIIPNFNHAPFLDQRILSVLGQSYQSLEVILLDDASADESVSVIEKYRLHPKVKHIVLNTENSGSTFRQWQKGISLAAGEMIWIAESDDFADSSFLQTAMDSFNKHPQQNLFFCNSARVNISGVEEGSFDSWLTTIQGFDFYKDFSMGAVEFVQKGLSNINVVMNASAVVFRKSAIKDFFKTMFLQFRYAGDWYFWAEIIQGGTVFYSARKLNYFRFHSSTTRATKPFTKQIAAYLEELQVLYLIAKKYDYIPSRSRINKTMDNIITITPAKKLGYLFAQFQKKMPSLLLRLANRFAYRSYKKITGAIKR